MHHLLEKELATFESRTPSSRAALKKAEPRLPLGVASNFRSYEPWPLFIKDAKGSHIHDLDGNEYIDFNLCFGALMAGHCHPAVVAAVKERLEIGTMLENGALASRIRKHTKEAFGASLPPHWFRDAAATSIAVEDPRHVCDAHHILGNTLATTEKHYNQARSLEASRRHQAMLAAIRSSLNGRL